MDFVTVVTRSYFGRARALARSLRASGSAGPLYTVVVDGVGGLAAPEDESVVELLSLGDLGSTDILAPMTFYYAPDELCWAVKPFALEHVLRRGSRRCAYVDADLWFCGPLAPLEAPLAEASIALTPHTLAPVDEAHLAWEVNALRWGVFNSGFVGVASTRVGREFVAWWRSRTVDHAFRSKVPGIVGDQTWLDYVPTYFPDHAIVRHPGGNVAYWNLFERSLVRAEDGTWLAGGAPLLFVHFSGWSMEEPERVAPGRAPEYDATPVEAWAPLGLAYRDALRAAGHEALRRLPYGFDRFDDGRPITPAIRAAYHDLLRAGAAPAGSPFAHAEELSRAGVARELRHAARGAGELLHDALVRTGSARTLAIARRAARAARR